MKSLNSAPRKQFQRSKFPFMEEWKEYRIGDVCDTISDTYRGNAENVILINTSDVLEGKCLNHIKVPNKDLKGQFKKTFRKDDILYSEIRPANKRYAYIDFDATDYIASTKLMVIRHNERILPQYLFYILKSQAVLDELQMLAESRSGTFPQITFSEVANMEIKLPPIEQQCRILGVLKSLDDKIEVNRRINENLEQQAQALFKSWFVDFEPFKDLPFVESELGMIPQGWKVGAFGEIMIITSGKRPVQKVSEPTKDFIIPLIGASDVMGYTKESLCEGKILIIGRVGTHGIVQRLLKPCWPSDNTLVITSDYYEYCYQILKGIDYSSLNRGSTQPLITQTDIKNQLILIPTEGVLDIFEEEIGKLMQLENKCHEESRRLAELRDTLLPRLMSGELKVSDIKI